MATGSILADGLQGADNTWNSVGGQQGGGGGAGAAGTLLLRADTLNFSSGTVTSVGARGGYGYSGTSPSGPGPEGGDSADGVVLTASNTFLGLTDPPAGGAEDFMLLNVPFNKGSLVDVGIRQLSLSPTGAASYVEAPASNCQVGSCYEFDGSNSYVTLSADPVSSTGSFTVEAWINVDDLTAANSNYGMGVVRSTSGDNAGDFILGVTSTGSVTFLNWRTSGADPTGRHTTNTGVITPDQWHHVVARWDGSMSRIFIDGVDQGVLSAASTGSGWGTGYEIGRSFTSAQYVFDGKIDEVKIYGRSLSLSQIQQNYADNTNADPNLRGAPRVLVKAEHSAGNAWSMSYQEFADNGSVDPCSQEGR